MAGCSCSSGRSTLQGSAITIRMTFRDEEGELANPTSIAATWRDPSGNEAPYTEASPEITLESTGVWDFVSPATDEPGTWWFYAVGSGGGVDVAQEASYEVRSPHVTV